MKMKNKDWDHSILMTGRDLYMETNMNTNDYFVRGLANIGKACSSNESCTISEATKIHVAPFVITHELGHALGLTHDDMIEGSDRVLYFVFKLYCVLCVISTKHSINRG